MNYYSKIAASFLVAIAIVAPSFAFADYYDNAIDYSLDDYYSYPDYSANAVDYSLDNYNYNNAIDYSLDDYYWNNAVDYSLDDYNFGNAVDYSLDDYYWNNAVDYSLDDYYWNNAVDYSLDDYNFGNAVDYSLDSYYNGNAIDYALESPTWQPYGNAIDYALESPTWQPYGNAIDYALESPTWQSTGGNAIDYALRPAYSNNVTPFRQIATGGYSSGGYSTGGVRQTSYPQPAPQRPVSYPTPRPQPVPTPIPTPRPVPTPIPTPTPRPVPTPIPTPVPTPIPTPIPQLPTPTQLSCDMRVQQNGNFITIYYVMSSHAVSAYINGIGNVPVAVGAPKWTNPIYPPYASSYIMTVRASNGQTANCYVTVPQTPVTPVYPQYPQYPQYPTYPVAQPGVNVAATTYNPGVTYDYVTIGNVPYTGPEDELYVGIMLAIALGAAFAVFHFRKTLVPSFAGRAPEATFISERVVEAPAQTATTRTLKLKVENGLPKLTFN